MGLLCSGNVGILGERVDEKIGQWILLDIETNFKIIFSIDYHFGLGGL